MSENDNGIGVFEIFFKVFVLVMMIVSLLVLGIYVKIGENGLFVNTSSWGIFSWIVFVTSALVLFLTALITAMLVIRSLVLVTEKLVSKFKLWWIKTSQTTRDIVICIPWICLAIILLLFYYCG